MEEVAMQRDAQGKFALKNDEHREVRSLRLTDTIWSAMGVKAESYGITRADLLEQIFTRSDHPNPSNTRLSQRTQPSNTRSDDATEPSNTRYEEEIERLIAEVAHLREENAKLVERARVQLPQPNNLEAVRERVLKSLKLGKQAPGYKTAKLALNQFIELLRDKI